MENSELVESLKLELVRLARLDSQVRSDLIQRGLLFDGYHPEMEEVHGANADRLAEIIAEHGWPSKSLVGHEAFEAAWLIVQHAIGKPQFQRSCLAILKKETANGEIEMSQVAQLEDRILVFEGKAQVYGTQFDWDSNDELSPLPIADPGNVDRLRHSVGLPSLQTSIDLIRARAQQEGNRAPKYPEDRNEKFLLWARKVGWRN